MNYSIENIIGQVRIALDMNSEANEIIANDSNTLSIDEIIRQKIEHGVRMVLEYAPIDMIDTGVIIPSSNITWAESEGIGKGSIRLPDDFLRLIAFKMSDWAVPVATAVKGGSEMYLAQQSMFSGVRGNVSRPIVAIVRDNSGKALEFYSCSGGKGVSIVSSIYIREPQIVSETISIPKSLYISSIYQIAGLVAMTIKDTNADVLFKISKGSLNEEVS